MKPITQEKILQILQEEYETRQLYETMELIKREEEAALEEARMYGIGIPLPRNTYDSETDTGRRIIIEDGCVIYDSYSNLYY